MKLVFVLHEHINKGHAVILVLIVSLDGWMDRLILQISLYRYFPLLSVTHASLC